MSLQWYSFNRTNFNPKATYIYLPRIIPYKPFFMRIPSHVEIISIGYYNSN